MPSTVKIDARIIEYTRNNDPLPSKLRPTLDNHLEEARAHIAGCDARICTTREGILKRQAKINSLEKEIKDLKFRLEQEVMAKKKNESRIRTLASTVAAIRLLPPELIARIIHFAVVDLFREYRAHRLIVLSSVSRLWRNTTLSTPLFWRSLHVELHRFSAGRSREQARLYFTTAMNEWLSRGGEGAEINIRIVGRFSDLECRDLIDWIKASRFNFSSLAFDDIFPSIEETVALTSGIPLSLQATKSLWLKVPPMPSTQLVPWIPATIVAKWALPNLYHLTLSGNSTEQLSLVLKHPRLSNLEIRRVELRTWDIRKILKGLPSLRSLQVKYCWLVDEDEPEAIGGHTHQSLGILSVNDMLWGQAFDDFTCPSLERLDLESDSLHDGEWAQGLEDESAEAFGNFIQRSSSSAGITLHLGEHFPPDFLNVLLRTSGPKISTLDLGAPSFLPLDIRADAFTRLVIPHCFQRIQSLCEPTEEEARDWLPKLVLCLKDPQSWALHVKFGAWEVKCESLTT
ncbi:hypothetical protein BKA70DRAFT_1479572 [Coprinopsis sp. MPI-PUGE-AT-0042]|nr:hypothetical protein BKA70DRAFT_1479572 [Coprinopsis sp. MPI-PUGE-AT-0042]